MNRARLLEDHAEYASLWSKVERRHLYASPSYLDLLSATLGADWHCLGARSARGELVGALPFFLKEHPLYGNVINSLPFFGSYGGVQSVDPTGEATESLIQGLSAYARECNCSAWTLISSPFDADSRIYDRVLRPTFRDLRISQTTTLAVGDRQAEEAILQSIHPTRRRNVRKARMHGVTTSEVLDQEGLEAFEAMHVANMVAIGGSSKPPEFFKALPRHFVLGREARLFAAHAYGRAAAFLLCFVCNGIAEYYMPAYDREVKSIQALSLLILNVMTLFAREGIGTWNWGGTWLTQEGVYSFKKKWGAVESRYQYYTTCNADVFDLTSLDRETLSKAYPYFYVLPYSVLCNDEKKSLPEKIV